MRGGGAAEQVERRPSRAVRREAAGHDRFREPGETLPQHRVRDVVERHQRRRVRHGRAAAAFQVDRAAGLVQCDHGAAEPPLEFVGFGGVGVLRRVSDLDLVRLVGEAVAVNDGALHLSSLALAGQRPERGPALDVLLLGEAAPVEELPPPHRLVLAPVKLQQVRQQASSSLLVVELGGVDRQPRGERLEQRRGLDRRFLLLVAFLVPKRGARHGLSGESLQFAPARFQPRGETQRREAVVAVVALGWCSARQSRRATGLFAIRRLRRPTVCRALARHSGSAAAARSGTSRWSPPRARR